MEEFKSGFVTILGRTNVGKSTLINRLVGEKIAITTRKPQTTRKAIKAIINRENSQIIITDTPGIHKPKTKLGEVMVDTSFSSVADVDLCLFLIEATEEGIGKGDSLIIEKVKEISEVNSRSNSKLVTDSACKENDVIKKPTILVINKIDLIKKQNVIEVIDRYKDLYDFTSIIPISAEKGEGIEELLLEIEKNLPKGPKYYEEDEYTDQTVRQLSEEIIREKALKLLDQEVPHGIYVELEKFSKKKNKTQEDYYQIEATIYCARNSHKPIIIGKDGAMLKKIGTFARQDIEKLLDTKVNLKLWVKIRENWLDLDSFVSKFKN